MHILLTNVHLDCKGEGSSNMNASTDGSVETRDELVETGDEFIEAGEKHKNHVVICFHSIHMAIYMRFFIRNYFVYYIQVSMRLQYQSNRTYWPCFYSLM